MRCFNCHEPAPTAIAMPHFCVRCGYPMAQPSPYMEDDEECYLALTDDHNRPPSACSYSGGLLKACRQCGRLYKLTAEACKTPRCAGPLVEPSMSFPTPVGALDGTHTGDWQGLFGSRVTPKMPRDTDRLSALAFRYGILVGVAPEAVILFQPEGDGWRRGSRVRLESPSPIRSLVLDDGYALIIAEKMTYRVPLSRVSEPCVEEAITESCLRQTSAQGRWARLVENLGENSILIVRDRKNQTESQIELPFAAKGVTDMVDGAGLVLATARDGLVLVHPQTGRREKLTAPACRWVRVALVGETVVALGYRDAGGLCIVAITIGNELLGQYDLPENYLADFAWMANCVYLATASSVATFDLAQLSRRPESVDLRHDEETQPKLLGLRDDEGSVRLLLRRKAGGIHKMYLTDPSTGSTIEVGGMQASEPLLALAGQRFVVGAYEGSGLRLRTLTFQEGA